MHACPGGRGKRSNDAAALIDTTGNEAGINKTLRVFFDEREREIQWVPCVESWPPSLVFWFARLDPNEGPSLAQAGSEKISPGAALNTGPAGRHKQFMR